MMPRQGKLLSYLTFLCVKEVLERGEKSKGILSRRQHWDNSVPDTLGSRSGFDKDPHPTEQLAISCNGVTERAIVQPDCKNYTQYFKG